MASDYEKITTVNVKELGTKTRSRKTQVSMYSDFTHFVYEILQNADDYGATQVSFKLSKKDLVIEHNGAPFEEENVKAITNFDESTSKKDFNKNVPKPWVDNERVLVDGEEVKPKVHLRVYLIRTKRSGQKLPRVEVEEMGPRMDFRVGRVQEADESVLKEAMKRARTSQERPKKNISTDIVGDKMGRIHLGKQDLKELQTRKMKGLKRARDEMMDVDASTAAGADEFDGLSSGDEMEAKRIK